MIVFLAVLFTIANYSGSNDVPTSDTNSQNIIKTPEEPAVNTEVVLNLEEVAKHDNKEDCWLVIRDKVYDVSASKFQSHPGGDAIYQGCGIDATVLFETRPMGTGTPHSDLAIEKVLPTFYVGDLSK